MASHGLTASLFPAFLTRDLPSSRNEKIHVEPLYRIVRLLFGKHFCISSSSGIQFSVLVYSTSIQSSIQEPQAYV